MGGYLQGRFGKIIKNLLDMHFMQETESTAFRYSLSEVVVFLRTLIPYLTQIAEKLTGVDGPQRAEIVMAILKECYDYVAKRIDLPYVPEFIETRIEEALWLAVAPSLKKMIDQIVFDQNTLGLLEGGLSVSTATLTQ